MTRAGQIASHGKTGTASALTLGSFGRVGHDLIIIIVPVEYTPFTTVSVEPHFYDEEILAREFFVEIVENENREVEVVAGHIYVLSTTRRFEIESLNDEYYVTVLEVAQYEVNSVKDLFEVAAYNGRFYEIEVVEKPFTVEVFNG